MADDIPPRNTEIMTDYSQYDYPPTNKNMNHRIVANRFHIVGAPGSGKSYLARKLAEKLNIPLLELDQIHWNNNSSEYNTKAPENERDIKLKEFVSGQSWVVEGIYYKWTDLSFKKSDVLIVLITPNWLRNVRILRRFVLSKLGLAKSNERSLKDVWALIQWGNSYNNDNLYQIENMTQQYADKRQFITSADAFLKQIKNIKF